MLYVPKNQICGWEIKRRYNRYYFKKVFFVIIGFSLLIAGCKIREKQIYYWKGYSESLYAFKRTPDKKNKEEYQKSLGNIISVSEKEGKRVAPGIFAEYGYRMAKNGREEEAAMYFDMEEKNYPESKAFVKHLRERFARFDLK